MRWVWKCGDGIVRREEVERRGDVGVMGEGYHVSEKREGGRGQGSLSIWRGEVDDKGQGGVLEEVSLERCGWEREKCRDGRWTK